MNGSHIDGQIDGIKFLLKLRRSYFGDGVVMVDVGLHVDRVVSECADLMTGWGTVLPVDPPHSLNIDVMELDRVDLLKIDACGREIEALNGVAQTIYRCRPLIIAEHIKIHFDVLKSWMDGVGYRCVRGWDNTMAFPEDAEYMMEGSPVILANELWEGGRLDEAKNILDGLIEANPSNYPALMSRAEMFREAQCFDEAIDIYSKIVIDSCDGGTASQFGGLARYHRGLCNLARGRLREGFADYDHYPVASHLPIVITDEPQLTRADLALIGDETVVVVGDGGFGDNIMFSRYLPMLGRQCAGVALCVQEPLKRLMQTVGGVQVVDGRLPRFNRWARLSSLACLFDTDVDSVPPPVQIRVKRERLPSGRGIKVGLCWAGNRISFNDAHRSVSLRDLTSLFDVPGIDFYTLQPDVRDADRVAYDELPLAKIAEQFDDFLDTAAAISDLDLVITVDTAVAHLAGSIGVPTWLMLTSFKTDWRWTVGREDSLWYPSVRCFKQSMDGQWGSVVEKIRNELSLLTSETKFWRSA